MLQSIRGAEDNYKAEVLNYMSCPLVGGTFSDADFYPRTLSNLNSKKAAWVQSNALAPCWTQLNVKSSGPVRYSFSIFAGPPGAITAPKPGEIPAAEWPFNGTAQTQNPWFVAVAAGDYEGDGIHAWLYLSSEMSDAVIVNDTE